MPRYTVTDPTTNKSIDLEGDSPPNEQELEQIFSQVHGNQPQTNAGNPGNPGFGSQVKNIVDKYNASQFGSPAHLLGTVQPLVSKGFDKLGQVATEQLSQGPNKVDPYTAAGVGTFISMAPDIASFVTPESNVQPSKPLFRGTSEPMAMRSMGLSKGFLKTPFAREKASQAAQVALENDIIPFSGNPEIALQRAQELQQKSGEAIGQMRDAVGSSSIEPVFDAIESARQKATNGLRGGAWDTIHKKFDEAQNTLLGLLNGGDEVPLRNIEKAKKLLSNTVNWVADNVSQESAKQISSAIESGVEDIMRSKGADMAAYEGQKRLFGASKTMLKGLNNEISAQTGNNAVSLPTMVAGAGQLATGNVPGAAATLGIMEGLRRRGAGFGARSIEEVGRQLPAKRLFQLPVVANRFLPSTPLPDSIFQSSQMVHDPGNKSKTIPNRSDENSKQPNNDRDEQQNQNNLDSDTKRLADQEESSPKPQIVQEQKILTKQKAREFLDLANGDKIKARKLARKAGYTW